MRIILIFLLSLFISCSGYRDHIDISMLKGSKTVKWKVPFIEGYIAFNNNITKILLKFRKDESLFREDSGGYVNIYAYLIMEDNKIVLSQSKIFFIKTNILPIFGELKIENFNINRIKNKFRIEGSFEYEKLNIKMHIKNLDIIQKKELKRSDEIPFCQDLLKEYLPIW